MTQEEARSVLGINETLTNTEIRKVYSESYSEFQIRLTNAPTPALRKLYTKNLDKLVQAFETLCPEQSPSLDSELPTDTPSYDSENLVKSNPKSAMPKPSKSKKKSGLLNIILMVITAVSIAGAVYMILATSKLKTELKEQATFNVDLQKEIDLTKPITSKLVNGKFRIKNAGTDTYYLIWCSAIFLDSEGNFRYFNSEDHKDSFIQEKFGPGKVLTLELAKGNETIWDGSVIFYSIELFRRNEKGQQEFYHFTGNWGEDVKDGTLKLNPRPS